MDDALSLSRSQGEESQAARMIYSTAGLYGSFIRYGAAAGSRGQLRDHAVTGSAAGSRGQGVSCGVSCRVMGSAVGSAVGSRGQLWGHGDRGSAVGLLGQLWGHRVSYGVLG